MTNLRNHKEKIVGIIISFIFIGLIFWNIDINKLLYTLKLFNYKILFIFIPLYIISLYIRGFRWKCLLFDQKDLTITNAFMTFTTGNTLNSFLPARAGDFWRAYHLGAKLKESKMKILGSIVLERIIDGISVLLILLFAILFYFKQQWVLNIAYISIILFVGSLSLFYYIVKTNKINIIFDKLLTIKFLSKFEHHINKTKTFLNNFMCGFQVFNKPKYFLLAFMASCVAWAIECLTTYTLILAFGHTFGISIAMFVISFLALSTIIPSSSIFVGPYQFAYILALGIYNIDKSGALAIAFVNQAIIMLTTTIITIIYFNQAKTRFEQIETEIKMLDNGETENACNTQSK